MIKSCKKPPVYFESTTGSFYSQYAGLPLKSCRVDLPVNQSGSGTPSPTNIRDLIPYTALDFTANGTVKTFTFGQNVYIGYLNILTGELVATHELKTIDENSGVAIAENGIFLLNNFFEIDEDEESVNCNLYQRGDNQTTVARADARNPDFSFCCKLGTNGTRIMIKHTTITTIEAYNEWLTNNPVKIAVKLSTPISIPLGGINLLTQEGVNNIFADCGDTEVKRLKVN